MNPGKMPAQFTEPTDQISLPSGYVEQLNLLRELPVEIEYPKGEPNLTLSSFTHTAYMEIICELGRMYIADFTEKDMEGYEEALYWAMVNPGIFFSAGDILPLSALPENVVHLQQVVKIFNEIYEIVQLTLLIKFIEDLWKSSKFNSNRNTRTLM